MSKLDTENLLVEPNGSFSESVSTTFVHDCRSLVGKLHLPAGSVFFLYKFCREQTLLIFTQQTEILTYWKVVLVILYPM